MDLKKLIIPLLLIGILTGCGPSRSANVSSLDKANTSKGLKESNLDKTYTSESPNKSSLDKTYTISQLSFKVSSGWNYKNIDGANDFYLQDGSMLFVSNSSLGSFSNGDMYVDMLSAYTDFTETATNVKEISNNYDSKNNVNTATFTADYGNGIEYVNYYATTGDKYFYCIVLFGDKNAKDKLDELFKEVISSVSLKNGAKVPDGIGLSKYEIINMMDKRLRDQDLPTFANATKGKLALNTDGYSGVTHEAYILTDGLTFIFSSDIKTGELLQLAYVVDRNEMSTDAYKALGFINGSLPYLFERDTYKYLDKKLRMDTDIKSFTSEAVGAVRKYTYTRSDNLSVLFVYPKGKEILKIKAKKTSSPSTGT